MRLLLNPKNTLNTHFHPNDKIMKTVTNRFLLIAYLGQSPHIHYFPKNKGNIYLHLSSPLQLHNQPILINYMKDEVNNYLLLLHKQGKQINTITDYL